MDWQEVIFEYVCPIGGCFLASSVFAAPINDLNHALRKGSLGSLNSTPWAVMSGNCLGWCAYAYYTADPFVLASNLPGLILSLWLNIGACKLQYLAQIEAIQKDDEADNSHDNIHDDDDRKLISQRLKNRRTSLLTSSPQDVILLRIISLWAVVLVCVGWLGGLLQQVGLYVVYEPQTIVGILVNINLVFFYGAPLQTMKTVLETKSSDSIHTRTVITNVINAIFWMSYGFTRQDIIIYGPNGVGLLLGIAQGILCCIYPKTSITTIIEQQNAEESVEFPPVVPYTDTVSSLKQDDFRSAVEQRII